MSHPVSENQVTFAIGKVSATVGIIALLITVGSIAISTGQLIQRIDQVVATMGMLTNKLDSWQENKWPRVERLNANVDEHEKRLNKLEESISKRGVR